METKKFMTFQEEVEPLSKDEKGLLTGGFVDVSLGVENSSFGDDSKNKNTSLCKNINCSESKNKGAACTNQNCQCTCGGSGAITDIGTVHP